MLRGSVSYQYSRYGLGDPLFIERCDDRFAVARLALEYTVAPNWRLSSEVQYSNNNSSRQRSTPLIAGRAFSPSAANSREFCPSYLTKLV